MAVAPLPPDLDPALEEKELRLEALLRSLERVLVAYSGGTDSAYLAFIARKVLGSGMLAVLADSPSLARSQMRDALNFASERGIPVQVITTAEIERPEYQRNDSMRCFHCKDELFGVMQRYAAENDYRHIAYGVNLDDQGDYRPGQRAAREHGVSAPMLEAGLTKADIRALARRAGLRIWDKPASACLSSRVEYGRAVTPEVLRQIEQGEDALRELGFRQFRVRHHGAIVRIEIASEEMPRAMTPAMAAEFARIFKALGFSYITLDLEGFRSGSMNSVLPLEVLKRDRNQS